MVEKEYFSVKNITLPRLDRPWHGMEGSLWEWVRIRITYAGVILLFRKEKERAKKIFAQTDGFD